MAGCVLRYTGKKGVTYSIKFDENGRQARERLGKATEGWTPTKARKALRARLAEIEKGDYRRPQRTTLAEFADGWVDEHCDARGLKRSTRHGYETVVRVHLLPAL